MDTSPETSDRVAMTAHIENPQEGTPSYQWQRKLSSGWRDVGSDANSYRVGFDSPGTRSYRVIVSYSGDVEATSASFSLTW